MREAKERKSQRATSVRVSSRLAAGVAAAAVVDFAAAAAECKVEQT